MNKLTKVGLSALCGSLASISANAGSLDVSGGATATWSGGSKTDTGNPIGMNSGITFTGSGELDGGQTFTLTLTQADKAAYSAGSIVIDTNSLGQFRIAHADGGSGIDAYDDKMPTAWEEVTGTSLGTGIDQISGVGGSSNIGWKLPTVGGLTLSVAYAPRNNGLTANDKAGTGAGTTYKQSGADIMLNYNPTFASDYLSGLNIFAGYHNSERDNDVSTGPTENDHEEGTAGLTFAYGPVTIGYQRAAEFTGSETATETEYYSNTLWGVSFNVSDNLSISYGDYESKRHKVGSTGGIGKTVITSADSLQVAYTMGGASIKIAESEVDNASYTSGTGSDKEGRTIALSLAF